jgi:hypothetical protein
MYRITLALIGLLSYLFVSAQNQPVSQIAEIHLPSGAKKLSNEQMRTMANSAKKFPEDIKTDRSSTGEYYQIDSLTLALYGGRANTNTNYLEDSKKSFEATFKKINCSTCTTEIQKINNYNALIVFFDTRDVSYYFFYTVNNDNNALVNGSITYDKSNSSNKKKAAKTIYELLNGMSFK